MCARQSASAEPGARGGRGADAVDVDAEVVNPILYVIGELTDAADLGVGLASGWSRDSQLWIAACSESPLANTLRRVLLLRREIEAIRPAMPRNVADASGSNSARCRPCLQRSTQRRRGHGEVWRREHGQRRGKCASRFVELLEMEIFYAMKFGGSHILFSVK
jgi:hypothetical protein